MKQTILTLYHFFWRPLAIKPQAGRKYKVTTAIYDHLYIDNHSLNSKIFMNSQSVYVSSKKLYDIYRETYGVSLPICEDGVDTTLFAPKEFQGLGPTIRFGWAGNSQALGNDHKGFNSIIKPLMKRLQEKDSRIQFHPADSSKLMRAHAEMPKYFRNIDIFLCASLSEGTPNPILEACVNRYSLDHNGCGNSQQFYW
jgi:hypothetical protein